MKFCTFDSDVTRGGFSRPKWVREPRPTERELLESLCSEINGLARDSKSFEIQYNLLQNYYHEMTKALFHERIIIKKREKRSLIQPFF